MARHPRVFPTLLALTIIGTAHAAPPSEPATTSVFRPQLRTPESLEPFVRHMLPGADSFPEEKDAQELAERLGELGRALRAGPAQGLDAAALLLAPDFKGAPLTPAEEIPVVDRPALRVFRARAMSESFTRDTRSFRAELQALIAGFRTLDVAEFVIDAIDSKPREGLARTEVRYDLVGAGQSGGRAERVGRWRMGWRRGAGRNVARGRVERHCRSAQPSRGPRLHRGHRGRARGRCSPSARSSRSGSTIGSPPSTRCSAATRSGTTACRSGDADGDGLEDLYIAQPSGCPTGSSGARATARSRT